MIRVYGGTIAKGGAIFGKRVQSALYDFTTFTFTNATATGRNGPTLANCQTTYSATSWTQNTQYFNVVTQGIQLWTVPQTALYEFEVAGAAGGTNTQANITGGYGAYIKTRINLTISQKIAIVVGQLGANRGAGPTSNYCGAGGGGGSFVYDNDSITYYVVAGGGGGGAATNTGLLTTQTTAHGKYDTTSGTSVSIQNGYTAAGGTGGNGGSKSTRNILYGGPGAGILTSGASSNTLQGRTRTEGWLGGAATATNSTYTSQGGFGGGGSAGCGDGNAIYAAYNWSGGGGGYSGGGCGANGGAGDGQYGGGGGSYYIGTFQTGSSGTNTSHGYVKITKL